MSAFDRNEKRTLVAVGLVILGGGAAGILVGRDGSGTELPRRVAPPATVGPAGVPREPAPVAQPSPGASAPPPPAMFDEPALARLAEESMVGPPALRLAAIERLAEAPREQAVPLLKRVLLNGDPAADRPAALLALRELALAQGDGDERIRDAVREVIYHGDDERFAAAAQSTLDAIAVSEDAIARNHGRL